MADIVIVQTPSISTIVSVGMPGPAGVQGPQGIQGPSSAVVSYNASADLSGHRVVRLDDGQLVSYASSTNAADANFVVGMTLGAATAGSLVQILMSGEITEPSWNWAPNLPIYLGATGLMTQVPPDASKDAFSLVVGFPISPTKAFISIREPIILTQ